MARLGQTAAMAAMPVHKKLGRAAAEFAMNPRDLRNPRRGSPGKGDSSAAVGPATLQTGAMGSGGGFR